MEEKTDQVAEGGVGNQEEVPFASEKDSKSSVPLVVDKDDDWMQASDVVEDYTNSLGCESFDFVIPCPERRTARAIVRSRKLGIDYFHGEDGGVKYVKDDPILRRQYHVSVPRNVQKLRDWVYTVPAARS